MMTPHILRVACPHCYEDGYLIEEWTQLENNEDAIQNFDLESLKWGCEHAKSSKFTFGVNDLDGQCITCKHNKGPCLAGGTLNECYGALCSSKKHIEKYDFADEEDGVVNLYRIETICDDMCEHYEKNIETFRLYLGTFMKVI